MNTERFHTIIIAAAHGGIAIVALTFPDPWLVAALELINCAAHFAVAFRNPRR